MGQVTDWLTHLTEPEAAGLLALARTQAGPLTAAEARAVLSWAATKHQRGYTLWFIQSVLERPAELTHIIGRPLTPAQPSAHGSRALVGALAGGGA